MGLANQWHIKKRIWGSTRRYAQSQTFHGIFTRHFRIIWPRSRYPCRHLTNGISVICRWPCPFFRIWWGITKTANCSVFVCFPLAYIVSIPKTKILVFNERYTKLPGSFHYGDDIIEKAEQYKYLGVVHSTKSTKNVLKETFSHIASQAGKSIFSLRKQSHPVVGKLSPTIAFKAFDCQILPILEYGSDIWCTGDDVNDLEKIHLKFIKSTLWVRKQTPTPAIYGDTGRFPLIIRQHIKAVKYWCRILKLSQSHPVRNAYNMLLELDGIGFTNWCSRIRSILQRTGLDQIWESQNVGDTNKFMLLFKESIVRIFTQQWRKDIES